MSNQRQLLEDKLAKAPTPALKAKYQTQLDELDSTNTAADDKLPGLAPITTKMTTAPNSTTTDSEEADGQPESVVGSQTGRLIAMLALPVLLVGIGATLYGTNDSAGTLLPAGTSDEAEPESSLEKEIAEIDHRSSPARLESVQAKIAAAIEAGDPEATKLQEAWVNKADALHGSAIDAQQEVIAIAGLVAGDLALLDSHTQEAQSRLKELTPVQPRPGQTPPPPPAWPLHLGLISSEKQAREGLIARLTQAKQNATVTIQSAEQLTIPAERQKATSRIKEQLQTAIMEDREVVIYNAVLDTATNLSETEWPTARNYLAARFPTVDIASVVTHPLIEELEIVKAQGKPDNKTLSQINRLRCALPADDRLGARWLRWYHQTQLKQRGDEIVSELQPLLNPAAETETTADTIAIHRANVERLQKFGTHPEIVKKALQKIEAIGPTRFGTPISGSTPAAIEIPLGKSSLRFRWISAGTHSLPQGDSASLEHGFWMAETECSFAHVSRVGDSMPLHSITFHDTMSVIRGLNDQLPSGHSFRLPTTTEWLIACAAGNTSTWSWGDDAEQGESYGNFSTKGEATSGAAQIGSLKSNNWGLYDMHGNVAEWCVDRLGEGQRAIIGGSWQNEEPPLPGDFEAFDEYTTSEAVGMRLVLNAPAPTSSK